MYTGKLIRLRDYCKDDVALAHRYLNDPEVKRFLAPGIPFPVTLQEEEKWVESQSASKDTYNFAIETIADSLYIGGCGINSVDWKNSVATVGIFIGNKEYWGKGYGTDAMRTLLSFIFDQMNIRKVRLCVYSFNPRAITCYEKCGFVKEGTLRQEIYRDGDYHDEYIMGIMGAEFNGIS